ncbi:hypothetical protein HCAG_01502 [Histoplasma mississippiense (nom. inval.)]|uniref:hypothetical protein n=1 Tax=Ajellomyces capsulatus (strain NAm1 / WU24) TaxID=2059318 RepID=UPI000157B6E8|nr:hypothetical protein HCAG_01502 [Histoplasma mississippiense (nom. inval.)]EDN03637.1 hypothetical protein HCAG_01502 [Histoplasma mississippiense (nom. inval.)]
MDYQNRAGSKFGGGGVASHSATNADRRERLRKLALENIDLEKDPYFFKNHIGSFECRLCLTVHQNDGSYLAHTQGRKHQTNLARRAAREQKEGKGQDGSLLPAAMGVQVKRNTVKIGRPGYKITKTRDPLTRQHGLLFQLQYQEITPGEVPRVRFMSAFEQKVDDPPDKNFQYLLVCGGAISDMRASSCKPGRWIEVRGSSGRGLTRTARSFGYRLCSKRRGRSGILVCRVLRLYEDEAKVFVFRYFVEFCQWNFGACSK